MNLIYYFGQDNQDLKCFHPFVLQHYILILTTLTKVQGCNRKFSFPLCYMTVHVLLYSPLSVTLSSV